MSHDGIGAGTGLLAGKRLLITGVATRDSMAFATAELAQRQGAEVVLTSFGRTMRLTERAARTLPQPVDVIELNAAREEDYVAVRNTLEERWGYVDGVLHAIAYAPPPGLGGNFLDTPPDAARTAFEISAYSLGALGGALAPLLEASPSEASIVGLDFDASQAWPDYDWMGVAKAALESVSRYLTLYLGPKGVRTNLVAAGPVRTLASNGVRAFETLCSLWSDYAPLAWSERPEAVAGPICFLFSDLAAGISGEILHVDAGMHAVASGYGALPPGVERPLRRSSQDLEAEQTLGSAA